MLEKGRLAADGAAIARNQRSKKSGSCDRIIALLFVMPTLEAGIHDLLTLEQDVDGRDMPGHDNDEGFRVNDRAGQAKE